LIYKSGAGSGKTYTLTREFLKLALEWNNPYAYKSILAVTFTKKAANEMKSRILDWLEEFSTDENLALNAKAIPILEYAKTANGEKCTAQILKSRAAKMHEHILHHYSDFSVQTIDSFVHKLIRAFSRDLKLSSDFEVELDVQAVIEQLVAEQLAEAGTNKGLTDVLLKFLNFQLEDEKSHKLSGELESFYKQTLDETAMSHLNAMSASSFEDFKALQREINTRNKTLTEEISTLKAQFITTAGESFQLINNNIKNWITRSSFVHLANYTKTPINALSNGKIFTVGALKKGGASLEILNQDLLNILDKLIHVLDEYKISSELAKSCYLLSLIQDYKKRFDNYKSENNSILISDFTSIIYDVIKDNPAPYIYERIGERFKYYLIDEFQDTSLVQWQNFLPLISHTLAKGKVAMLVGDSKQAIYRWRNGDFKLFSKLPSLSYTEDDFMAKEYELQLKNSHKPENLGDNFRSFRQIVEFNNQLFSGISSHLSELGKGMYHGFRQEPALKEHEGYVEFRCLGKMSEDGHKWLELIHGTITDAVDRGFDLGDIAIITRKNGTISNVAQYLSTEGLKCSSSEGLLLANQAQVNIIIAFLKAITYPDDESVAIEIFNLLELRKGNNPDLLLHPECLISYSLGNRTYQKLNLPKYLEDYTGRKPQFKKWANLSAYECIQKLIQFIGLDKSFDSYLETLLDFSFTARKRNVYGITDFITYWEEHPKLSLSASEDKDAVKLMTIHKSKGLEFPVVIYAEPFSSGRTSEIWYNLENLKLPLERTLFKATGFFKDHQGQSSKYDEVKQTTDNETSNSLIDDVNLFYVAATRASQNLFIFGFDTARCDLQKITEKALISVFQHDVSEQEVLQLGAKERKFSKNLSDQKTEVIEKLDIDLNFYDWQQRLAYKFTDELTKETTEDGLAERKSGIAVHALLAQLKLVEDWTATLEKIKPLLDDSEIFSGLKKLVLEHNWQKWFSAPTSVINEQRMADSSGSEFIPDRVMEFNNEMAVVDYKTGEPKKSHPKQVKNYMTLLSELYQKPAKGYLVYLKPGEILEVTL